MLEAIKHGLGGLTNFNGRDARQAFWYYVLSIVIVTFVVSSAISTAYLAPMMVHAVNAGMEAAKSGGAASDPAAILGGDMTAMMHSTMYLGVGLGLLKLALLAAALVRRCHDSDLPGTVAAIPLAIYAISLVLLATQIDRIIAAQLALLGRPDAVTAMLTGPAMMITLLSYGAMIVGIVIGVRKSTDGPNRFGEAPFVA